jgi:hypothetical protein
VDVGALPLDVLVKIGGGGGWAVAFWVLFYYTRRVTSGDLVPRKTHEDALRAAELQSKRNDEFAAGFAEQTDSLKTVEQFVRALPTAPARMNRRS